jgi:hypothetical protein
MDGWMDECCDTKQGYRNPTHFSMVRLTHSLDPSPHVTADSGGLVLARLGSLAGVCLPSASPSKAGGTQKEAAVAMAVVNSDGDDDEGTSPFNEGYGTRRALPRDLSLKSGLCFEAARPFDWCRAVPAHLEAEGMLQHLKEAAGVAPTAASDEEEDESGLGGLRSRDEALAQWVAASYYYAHPADRLPQPQHLALQQVRRQVEGAFAPRDAAPVAATAWQPQGGEGEAPAAQPAGAVGALYRRLREWEEAFRHLYGLYRHDPAASFYLVAPDFTVAFTREEAKGKKEGESDDESLGRLTAEVDALLSQNDDDNDAPAAAGGGEARGTTDGDDDEEEEEEEEGEEEEAGPRLKAVISTSKRWLRERLRAAGVRFRVPLAPDAAARDKDVGPAPDVRAELEALLRHDVGVGGHATVELQVTTRRRPVAGGSEIPRHRSQLVVEGALGVHGLFTFLSDLGNDLAPSAVGDVPRLLALKPFAHGVLGRLQVAANTPVQRTLLAATQGGGGMETVYQLRLRGPVLPSQLRRLAGVVHYFNTTTAETGGAVAVPAPAPKPKGAMAEGDWTLTMDVAPGTEAFNNSGAAAEAEKEKKGAMSMKEVRYHAAKGRFVTIRMTAPSSSSSLSSRPR